MTKKALKKILKSDDYLEILAEISTYLEKVEEEEVEDIIYDIDTLAWPMVEDNSEKMEIWLRVFSGLLASV